MDCFAEFKGFNHDLDRYEDNLQGGPARQLGKGAIILAPFPWAHRGDPFIVSVEQEPDGGKIAIDKV